MNFSKIFQKSQRAFVTLLLISAPLFLSSCISIRSAPEERGPLPTSTRTISSRSRTITKRTIRPERRGFKTHIVAPGETLWRISKIYDVPVASIISINHVKSDQDLQMGEKLNIPHAKDPRQLITLYPSDKWQYIIVHHSATDEGSSLQFHRYHQGKGWDSVGYHFIIDNGESGKPDGFIEIGPRWLNQLNGAHCKAGNMNTKSIGICLVGNFNEKEPTKAQMDSLVYLVNRLKKYYKISSWKIMGHGQVSGALTDCPGKHFPWETFKKKLQ